MKAQENPPHANRGTEAARRKAGALSAAEAAEARAEAQGALAAPRAASSASCAAP